MARPEDRILFWLEIAIGGLGLLYALAGLFGLLPRRGRIKKGRTGSSSRKATSARSADTLTDRLIASAAAVTPALGIVIAAIAGIYSNPYFRQLGMVNPTAVIQHIDAISGNPCERSVLVKAKVPSGDAIAVGSRQQGAREEDFQSSQTRQSSQEWVFTVEIGDHAAVGKTFYLTPIILSYTQEQDLLDAIRTNSVQDQTSTYWPSTGPPSSTIYVGNPDAVVHTNRAGKCPQ